MGLRAGIFLSAVFFLLPQVFAIAQVAPDSGAGQVYTPENLRANGVYDFVTASYEGKSIGEMVLDIEGAPERAYDVLEYAVFTSVYAIRPQDDELTALRKVDAILFEHMGFIRGAPGTTFSDALTKGMLDCSDASIIYISAAQLAGRDWRAVMAPYHMFVAAPEGKWFIFWETQAGVQFDVYDMITFHGLRQELIDSGIYLNRMSTRQLVAEAYRNIAGKLVREGELSKAVGLLNKSLWLWPDHPPTLIWRGYAYALSGKNAEAERDYLAALAIDPYDWVANLHLGILYINNGKPEEGRRLMELSEKYRPPNSEWVLDEAMPYILEHK